MIAAVPLQPTFRSTRFRQQRCQQCVKVRHPIPVRSRLTIPRNPSSDSWLEQELEADPEAAQEIRKYLALADSALRRGHPFLVKRRADELTESPETKRAA